MTRTPIVAVLEADQADEFPGRTAAVALAEVRVARTGPELAAAIEGAGAVLLWEARREDLRRVWPNTSELRWIHFCGAGVDGLLFPELTESAVVLTNARGIFDEAIAEYVAGLLLALAIGLPRTLEAQRRHAWERHPTRALAGTRALIIGAGSVGRRIARLLRRMGLAVEGVAAHARMADPDFDRVVGPDLLGDMLGEADHVIVAVPLTSATKGMISEEQFTLMRPTATIVNVARGEIVDEHALIEAVHTGRIAGAAIDVFSPEPLPNDHPLWDVPNVIISPHKSAYRDDVGERLGALFVENLRRWVQGEPLLNVVDKRLGYIPGPHQGYRHRASSD